jgi:hypothetical protein
MRYVKVKDDERFVKDTSNQAILNRDNAGLMSYKKKRESQKEITNAVSDINSMKQEMNDIKLLMQRILDKIG